MEIEEGGKSGGGKQWWWGVASAAQMGLGMRSYAKGFAGDSTLMPFKAFLVASLFVGSAASASVLLLHANGIHKVEDFVEAGANLRAKLGLSPRTHDKKKNKGLCCCYKVKILSLLTNVQRVRNYWIKVEWSK